MKKLIPLIILFNFSIKAQDVKIESQTWASKNLDVSTYRNGDVIPEVQDSNAWSKLTTGAWCYYENDASNGTKYGKLYNWYAVNDPRGLAPKGYHIPGYEDWLILTDYLDEDIKHGVIILSGTKMKSTSGWAESRNGTNSSGFLGLPGGTRNEDGTFRDISYHGVWWSTSNFQNRRKVAHLSYDNDMIIFEDFPMMGLEGLSVRCIKD
jgi:uncharacterized protein (TIGR02145 family)